MDPYLPIKQEMEEVREDDAYQIEVKVEEDLIDNGEAMIPKLETTFREIINRDINSRKTVTPTVYTPASVHTILKDVKVEEHSAVTEACSAMSFAGTTRIISSDSVDVYRYKFHDSQSQVHHLDSKGIHVIEKPYRCSNCEKCVQKDDFVEHQLHSLWCHNCEKTQEHQITHLGKGHRCSNCDSNFYCQCGLTQHMRTHTGEKPFQLL
ncbi:unnamed protein product, partial [Meganyctiphanes norvegica]